MKYLKADWRKWSGMERISAVLVAFAMSGLVPALLSLGHGYSASPAQDHRTSSWRMLT